MLKETYLKDGKVYNYEGGIYVNISFDGKNNIDCFSSMNMNDEIEEYGLPLIVENWLALNFETGIVETLMNSNASEKKCYDIFYNIIETGGYKELTVLNNIKDAYIYDKIMYIESYEGVELKYNLINDSFTY
jgi:hypothetical protein